MQTHLDEIFQFFFQPFPNDSLSLCISVPILSATILTIYHNLACLIFPAQGLHNKMSQPQYFMEEVIHRYSTVEYRRDNITLLCHPRGCKPQKSLKPSDANATLFILYKKHRQNRL